MKVKTYLGNEITGCAFIDNPITIMQNSNQTYNLAIA